MELARRDHQTLSRIAALLVALAVLAKRAGGRSFPVRFLVLAILGKVEAVARTYVVETMPAYWPCVEQSLESESGPMDAAWLAWRFRMLAAMLGALLNCCFDSFGIGPATRRVAPDRRILITPRCWWRRPDDTS